VIEEEEEGQASSAAVSAGKTPVRRALIFVTAGLILALPQLPGISPFWLTLLNYAGIYSIVTIGLVVLTGGAGITSFGQAIFAGLGAYTTAVLTLRYGLTPLLTLPAALLLTAAVAWAIGLITFRLSGHYLAVATIAWNISFFYLAVSFDFLGRNDGLAGLPPISLGGFQLFGTDQIYYLIWGMAGLAALLTSNLLNSRIGRSIRALKGGVLAAEASGIETARVKILAFVYAAMLAAAAGWLYAHLQRAVNPTPFGLNASIEYLLMSVAGGAGHIGGAIGGAAIVLIIKDQLQNVLPKLTGTQLNFETVAFGAALVIILQAAREGLWPHLTGLIPGLGPQAPHLNPEARALPHRERRAEAAALLRVCNLRKSFGGLTAVDGISFEIRPGEITGLIGPNGAGKSTAFNLISGVLPLSDGKVYFRQSRIDSLPAHAIARLGIARTFQHVKLVPGMSAIENVALGAHLRGSAGTLSAALHWERAEEASLLREAALQLRRVGLGDVLHRPAVALSLGQQRIVEVARALCLDPALLLLDEPAAGLRRLEKASLAALLRKLQSEGVAILLVEHDMEFVMGLASRLIVMNFGTKLAEGTPEAIRANPAVIEAYLGSIA
jgi:branched-chain amino acid transport system permease protein